jgi:hypothetical protein
MTVGKRLRLIFFLMAILLAGSAWAAEETCITCHQGVGGTSTQAIKEWRESIHRLVGVTCSGCHGGDPRTEDPELSMSKARGFVGAPRYQDIPAFCARCHADAKRMRQFNVRTDQFAEYKTSRHGMLLAKGDKNVATCTSCHGAHDIRKKDDPLASVYKFNIPKLCSKCHSDPVRMAPYRIPTNQLDEYKKSHHGKMLLEKNDLAVPTCADCHGFHGAAPPGVGEVANVCGNCHNLIAGYFRESPHQKAVQKMGVPKCITCHGNHFISRPNLDMLVGTEKGHCGQCHDDGSPAYKLGANFKKDYEETNERLDKALAAAKDLRKQGFDITDFEEWENQVKNKLIEARPTTHSVSAEKINAKFAEPQKLVDKMQERAKIMGESLVKRRWGVAAMWVLLAIMGASIWFKRRGMIKDREKGKE